MTEPGQRPDPRKVDRGKPRAFGSDIRRAQVDAELAASTKARELGHDPHPWARTTVTSSTACRRCGAGARIELHATAADDAAGEPGAAPDAGGVDVTTSGRMLETECRTAPRAAIDVTDPRD